MGCKFLLVTLSCFIQVSYIFALSNYSSINLVNEFNELIHRNSKLISGLEYSIEQIRSHKYFKINFKGQTFSYKPFINGIRPDLLGSQFHLTGFEKVSSLAVKEISYQEKSNLHNLYWQFSFCHHYKTENDNSNIIPNYESFYPPIPDFRFDNYVFSWTAFKSSQFADKNQSLIPNLLLDAICQNNFEVFFLQKRNQDDFQHSIYLDTLHSTSFPKIAQASSINFSDYALYIMIAGVVCFFVSGQTKELNIPNSKIREI